MRNRLEELIDISADIFFEMLFFTARQFVATVPVINTILRRVGFRCRRPFRWPILLQKHYQRCLARA